MSSQKNSIEQVIAATSAWLRDIVIGLNLCPFAAAPYRKNQVRLQVSAATAPQGVLNDLMDELLLLNEADPNETATTLLIIPDALTNFLDYNDFLDIAETVLHDIGLDGVLQIASFHPQYQFADAPADALSHYTNRSPYPILHLIREDDITRATTVHPDIALIPEHNIRRLENLGESQVKALLAACYTVVA